MKKDRMATKLTKTQLLLCSLLAAVAVATMPTRAWAQAKGVGGHVGIATPLVTVSKTTESLSDNFRLAYPIGVSVKASDRLVIDFEAVVTTHMHPAGPTDLTVDPGVVYNFGPVAAGLRIAFPIGAYPAAVGLIPLVNRGLVDLDGATWFVEAAFPTIYHGSAGGSSTTNEPAVAGQLEFNVVLHTGFAF